jgi:hypothetical protein
MKGTKKGKAKPMFRLYEEGSTKEPKRINGVYQLTHKNWKPRPEVEKQEEFHALTAHRYDKRREIR